MIKLLELPTVQLEQRIKQEIEDNIVLEEEERKEFLEEMISPHLHSMFVTPKDVDETVKRLGFTISEGLNIALEYV